MKRLSEKRTSGGRSFLEALWNKAVSFSPFCDEITGFGRIFFDLIPQPLDVDQNRIIIRCVTFPDLTEQVTLGKKRIRVFYKEAEKGEFLGGQGKFRFSSQNCLRIQM